MMSHPALLDRQAAAYRAAYRRAVRQECYRVGAAVACLLTAIWGIAWVFS